MPHSLEGLIAHVYLLLELFNKHSQNLARAAIIALVVLVTLSIGNTLLFVVDMATNEPAMVPGDAMTGPARPGRGAAEVSIAEFNLFGSPVRESAPAQQLVDAPETKLNLTLEGVFTAENEADSTAIVAEARKPGELYRIGDTLPGRVTLSAVYDDHVILQRGSRYEKLRFSEDSLVDSGIELDESDLPQGDVMPDDAMVAPDPLDDEDEEDAPLRSRRRGIPDTGQSVGTAEPSPLRRLIDQYRDRMESDPDGLLSQLGLQSVESGGSSGYQLGNQVSAQQLQRAGLMPGDIVVSVNGQPVNTIMQNQGLIDQALSSGRVRVEIQRQERRFFVTIPIR